MTRDQIRTIACGLFHEGIDVDKLSGEAKAELRKALDVVLTVTDKLFEMEKTMHPQHRVWELLEKHFPGKADFIVSLIAPYLAPCGECHLRPGEVCDICGRREP